MPIEITIPRLGWSMEEGLFAGWIKADGDTVTIGEPIYALESEKVTMEVESLDNGILHIPIEAPAAGSTVLVGQLVGYLLVNGEPPPGTIATIGMRLGGAEPSAPIAPDAAGNRTTGTSAPAMPAAPAGLEAGTGPARSGATTTAQPGQLSPAAARSAETAPSGAAQTPASPRARAAARDLGIDITTVQPREGAARIIEADVLKTRPAPTPRAGIAARMEESFRAPHFYLHADANVEALAAIRHQHRPASYNDFLIKAIAIALVRHPRVNAYWNNGAVSPRTTAHVALATQIGDTLMTPVITDPAEKSLAQIARDREQALIRKDASATLSNLGSFGVDRFEAILNPPQSIIVAVGKIAKRPVVVDDQVVARLTMPISLSVDHRVVDGVPAAAFLQTLIGILESPAATYNEWE